MNGQKVFPRLKQVLRDRDVSELLRGSSAVFVIRVLAIFTSYVFTLLITRNYGAHTMGIFSLCQALLLIAGILGTLGFDTASIRFVAGFAAVQRRDLMASTYKKILRIVVPHSLGISGLIYVCSPFLAEKVFHDKELCPGFRVACIAVVPFVLLLIHSESLRGLKKVITYAIFRRMSIPLASALALVPLMFWSKSALDPVYAYATGIFLLVVPSIFLLMKGMKALPEGSEGGELLTTRQIFSVAVPLMLSSSMLYVNQWVSTIIIGIFLAENEVGIFHVALRVAAFTSIPLFAINSMAAPKFAECFARSDMASLGKIARQSTRMIFWTSCPILLLIFLWPEAILSLFGKDFVEAKNVLLLLSLGQLVNALSGSVGHILQMTGKQNVYQMILLAGVTVNIVLNLILTPICGIEGAAVSNMVGIAVWNLTAVFFVKKYFNFLTLYVPIPRIGK